MGAALCRRIFPVGPHAGLLVTSSRPGGAVRWGGGRGGATPPLRRQSSACAARLGGVFALHDQQVGRVLRAPVRAGVARNVDQPPEGGATRYGGVGDFTAAAPGVSLDLDGQCPCNSTDIIYIQRACRRYGEGGPSQQSLGGVGGSSELKPNIWVGRYISGRKRSMSM